MRRSIERTSVVIFRYYPDLVADRLCLAQFLFGMVIASDLARIFIGIDLAVCLYF